MRKLSRDIQNRQILIRNFSLKGSEGKLKISFVISRYQSGAKRQTNRINKQSTIKNTYDLPL